MVILVKIVDLYGLQLMEHIDISLSWEDKETSVLIMIPKPSAHDLWKYILKKSKFSETSFDIPDCQMRNWRIFSCETQQMHTIPWVTPERQMKLAEPQGWAVSFKTEKKTV